MDRCRRRGIAVVLYAASPLGCGGDGTGKAAGNPFDPNSGDETGDANSGSDAPGTTSAADGGPGSGTAADSGGDEAGSDPADSGDAESGHGTTDGDTPGDAGCPWGDAVPDVPEVGLSPAPHIAGGTADEGIVYDRMNDYRAAPLLWNDCLADLARAHAQDQIDRGYVGHGSAAAPGDFGMVAARFTEAGYVLTMGGWANENILEGDLEYWLGGDIGAAADFWYNHAAPNCHRWAIDNCDEVGVGVVLVDQTLPAPYTHAYVTADFVCTVPFTCA